MNGVPIKEGAVSSYPVRGSFQLSFWHRLWLLFKGRLDVEFRVLDCSPNHGVRFEGPFVWLYEGRSGDTLHYWRIQVKP